MERAKNIVIVALLVFYGLTVKASFKTEIYHAYISNNMKQWKTILDKMEKESRQDNEYLLELINYQYGYTGWCMGMKDYKQAKEIITKAERNIEILEKNNFELSMLCAYKSAFYGFRIEMNKLQAPFIGPKSIECAKKSIKLDENNPYGYIQTANAEFYMSSAFGGSKTVALENFLKAEKLMEKKPDKLKDDWNYLGLLVMIINCYKALKQYDMAMFYCEKALKTEPEFLWVKLDLYPEIKELTKNKK